jgi:nucleotide-binding universal stress UspA family protein
MHAVISYDDTLNDHDALALGRVLSAAGAELTLAYVRHTTLAEPSREELEESEARALLERGARWLDDLAVDRRVVIDASTGEGLRRVAEAEEADLVVFVSDYRTPAGHVALGSSASRLLDIGATPLAVAPAAYRARRERVIRAIGVLPWGDPAVLETAESLAERIDAEVVGATRGIDMLIVGSRNEAREGRVLISSHALGEIENAECPVIVLARATPLRFEYSLA